eukprot:SAG31_NODE_12191_length_960_cov_1.108014_2_plen_265_part_01
MLTHIVTSPWGGRLAFALPKWRGAAGQLGSPLGHLLFYWHAWGVPLVARTFARLRQNARTGRLATAVGRTNRIRRWWLPLVVRRWLAHTWQARAVKNLTVIRTRHDQKAALRRWALAAQRMRRSRFKKLKAKLHRRMRVCGPILLLWARWMTEDASRTNFARVLSLWYWEKSKLLKLYSAIDEYRGRWLVVTQFVRWQQNAGWLKRLKSIAAHLLHRTLCVICAKWRAHAQCRSRRRRMINAHLQWTTTVKVKTCFEAWLDDFEN